MNQTFAPVAAGTRAAVAVAVLAAAIAYPFMASDFACFMAAQILVYAIAILGLNLLTGLNGQISLGHGAFFAMGAYAVALATERHVHYLAAVPLAATLCFVAGFLFGLPALRLRGHYLAMATFSLALALPQLLKHKAVEPWSGGAQGITLTKPGAPFAANWFGRNFSDDTWLYFIVLLFAVLLYIFAARVAQSRMGRALVALRDHQLAAESMGVNAAMVKSLTFGLSALYTGVAGGLSALVTQYVAPDSFTMALSIALLVGLVIGGTGVLPGSFLGAAFIVFVPNVANEVSRAATGAIYGLLLLCTMFLMPRGLWLAAAAALRHALGWVNLVRRRPVRPDKADRIVDPDPVAVSPRPTAQR